MRNVLLIV